MRESIEWVDIKFKQALCELIDDTMVSVSEAKRYWEWFLHLMSEAYFFTVGNNLKKPVKQGLVFSVNHSNLQVRNVR